MEALLCMLCIQSDIKDSNVKYNGNFLQATRETQLHQTKRVHSRCASIGDAIQIIKVFEVVIIFATRNIIYYGVEVSEKSSKRSR